MQQSCQIYHIVILTERGVGLCCRPSQTQGPGCETGRKSQGVHGHVILVEEEQAAKARKKKHSNLCTPYDLVQKRCCVGHTQPTGSPTYFQYCGSCWRRRRTPPRTVRYRCLPPTYSGQAGTVGPTSRMRRRFFLQYDQLNLPHRELFSGARRVRVFCPELMRTPIVPVPVSRPPTIHYFLASPYCSFHLG